MTAQILPALDRSAASLCFHHTSEAERVLSNRVEAETPLTVCVSSNGGDPRDLLSSLIKQRDADTCTVVIYHSGRERDGYFQQYEDFLLQYPGPATFVSTRQATSLSELRERFLAHTTSDWLVLLDSDSRPDDLEFLTRYLTAARSRKRPALYAGGLSLRFAEKTPLTSLDAAFSHNSDCRPPHARAASPGPLDFSSNILVHRYILHTVGIGQGPSIGLWDHVDWALNVAHHHRVEHVENTVTRLNLDYDIDLIRRYARSGASFAYAAKNHPHSLQRTRLYRTAKLLSRLPLRSRLRRMAQRFARRTDLSLSRRLIAFRVYRAALYAEFV